MHVFYFKTLASHDLQRGQLLCNSFGWHGVDA